MHEPCFLADCQCWACLQSRRDNEQREALADVLMPHVWPGRHYVAADAVLSTLDAQGIVTEGGDAETVSQYRPN